MKNNFYEIEFDCDIVKNGVNFFLYNNQILMNVLLINGCIIEYCFNIGNFECKKAFINPNNPYVSLNIDYNDIESCQWINYNHLAVYRRNGEILFVSIDNKINISYLRKRWLMGCFSVFFLLLLE